MRTGENSMKYHADKLLASKIPCAETDIQVRRTICAICEGPASSCGVEAFVKDGRIVRIQGDKRHPASGGTLCSKGSAGRQYVYNPDRILTPLKRMGERGEGRFAPIGWDAALDDIAARLLDIKADIGPQAVAAFCGYTKWLRPFLQRMIHSFGSPNFMTESSTCYFAAALAAKLTYGAWGGPDMKNARCLLVWSNNPMHTGTGTVRRLLDARAAGLKLIVVGPMSTPLTRLADIHLCLRPGTDGALALGMANVIIQENLYDAEFVERWTTGFDAFRDYAARFTPEKVKAVTGVDDRLMIQAARLYAGTRPAAMMNSASATVHHTNGIQNHRALTALVGLTGNYDVPGGNYVLPETWLHVSTGAQTNFKSFTWPRPWREMAPRVGAGRFPVWADVIPEAQSMHLPQQIMTGRPYPIKAVLGFGLNHRMWPGPDVLLESLRRLDLFVQTELFMTDAAKYADYVLPACTSYERTELRFYPGNHVVWTQPAIAPLGESRSDADIIFDLARRIVPDDPLMKMGYAACVDYILEPTGLTTEFLSDYPGGYTMPDVNMPGYQKYKENGFATPSGKMEFDSAKLRQNGIDGLPVFTEPAHSPLATPDLAQQFPLVLNTGSRLPMYIHSRTFRNPWNKNLAPEPFISINPEDAAERGIIDNDMVVVATPRSAIKVRAHLTETIMPGVAGVYHGWTSVEVNRLVDPDYLDPISGFPGFKSLLCQVTKMEDKGEPS
jgi:anaerobic selenocysteine-containing dehydrogenase